MTKAAIYTRVSTTDQAEEGYGLDAQMEQCRAMATVKGWDIAAHFSDDGISGTKSEDKRPGLAALTEAIDAGIVDAVIISSLDRLGRSTRLVLRIVDSMDSSGVDLVSCKEALDTSTPSGRFVLRMFASLAELERDNIVERTTAGRDARGRIDGEKGGRVPMGYQRILDEKGNAAGVVVDDQEADVIRDIFALRAADNSLRAIAANLKEKGVSTRRGSIWHASSVRAVLRNEDKYRGGQRGDSAERWPAILRQRN